jgi:hypothetical protein
MVTCVRHSIWEFRAIEDVAGGAMRCPQDTKPNLLCSTHLRGGDRDIPHCVEQAPPSDDVIIIVSVRLVGPDRQR